MKEEYYGEREEKREVRVSSFSSFSSFSSCFEEQEKRDVAEGGPLLLHPIWTTSFVFSSFPSSLPSFSSPLPFFSPAPPLSTFPHRTDTERVAYVQENNVYIETIDFTVPEVGLSPFPPLPLFPLLLCPLIFLFNHHQPQPTTTGPYSSHKPRF